MYLTTDQSAHGLGIITQQRPCFGPCCNLSPCSISAEFCENLKKLEQAQKDLENAKDRLEREKWWYQRWKCENWPSGSRMPDKVRDICEKKKTEITQIEELVRSRGFTEGALRSKHVDLLKRAQAQCGRFPNRFCDCLRP